MIDMFGEALDHISFFAIADLAFKFIESEMDDIVMVNLAIRQAIG